MKRAYLRCFGAILLLMLPLMSCKEQSADSVSPDSITDEEAPQQERQAESVQAITFSKDGFTQCEERFLPDYSQLVLSAPADAEIYYTLDGSKPDQSSEQYTEPIVLEQFVGDFPNCAVLRAKAYFSDGSESEIATHTFWTSFDIEGRFRNPVISIVGDPAEITEKPDGIFTGENIKLRGRESEREISVEMVNGDGSLIFAQDAGLRLFGAASREASLKSMKLFARKSYDPEHGKFAFDGFGTVGADGEIISKYDKLVVRNGGNDFQFAFIRDELNQTLAKQAGYTDCEAVMPVVVYLNGEYYALHWLHETICDDLLKDKYGGDTGEYIILEGKELEKNVSETDADEAAEAEEFNNKYEYFSGLDLTDEEAFSELEAWMDVTNYLDYFAFNIYVNNKDWPQNNMKVYRYRAAADEAYSTASESRTDGRWRWWIHDTDYAEGLYEQEETQANYNNLAEIMNPESERWSPLFTALMQREDCRTQFVDQMHKLMEGTLSGENICETLDAMNTERFIEMRRYFDRLETLKKSDKSIWIWYEGYQQQTNMIRNFANARAEYMEQFLEEAFADFAEET